MQALIIAERRRLHDDLLEELEELHGEVGLDESLNSNRYVIGICTFGDGSRNDLYIWVNHALDPQKS